MFEHISVKARSSGFGAQIKGINIAAGVTPAQLKEIKQAWFKYSVVWFPDQILSHQHLYKFAQHFGEIAADPYGSPIDKKHLIYEIYSSGKISYGERDAAWQSSWSYLQQPPSATLIHAKVVSAGLGETLFADCSRAFELLSPVMQEMLSQLEIVHVEASGNTANPVMREVNPKLMRIEYSRIEKQTYTHPMVRTHPETGRKSLFINPVYTAAIKGMSDEENLILLSWLYDHLCREDLIHRHHWDANTLVLWDNRCVNHYQLYAEKDEKDNQRLMHKVSIVGEKPYI